MRAAAWARFRPPVEFWVGWGLGRHRLSLGSRRAMYGAESEGEAGRAAFRLMVVIV